MAIEWIKEGKDYVVRFKSEGDFNKKIVIKDGVKGKLELPQDDQDIVIIKSDGLPTYHFAHAVDDHLMGTNLVTRSDEWLPSLPLHINLFLALGFKVPKYAHISPLLKLDEGNKRKLSKRKDPESNAVFLMEEGIPKNAIVDYLMNIANSNFEMWRKQNIKTSFLEFNFELSKMNSAGALFDMVKLLDVSKNYIANLSKEEVFEYVMEWSEKYDKHLYSLLSEDKEKAIKIFGIEREGRTKLRKDISKWSDVKEQNIYMFNSEFAKLKEGYDLIEEKGEENIAEVKNMAKDYISNYLDLNDDKETWFNKIKDLSEKYGYAREVKEYKANPENYKGHVGDVSSFLRVVFTKRNQTPDLYEILNVLGMEEIENRVDMFLKH